MSSPAQWLWTVFLLAALPLAAQTTPTTSPTAAETASATPTASPVTAYRFSSDTVWAHLEVVVKPDTHGFSVETQSNSPLSGWILKDPSGTLLSKGGCGPQPSLRFEVAGAFEFGDSLTLFIEADHEQIPAVLHLTANFPEASAGDPDLPAGVAPFQEDADRPFNKMVETLYSRAAQDYGRGQTDDALSLLKKAQELDPLQAQVQALLDKVRGTLASSAPPSGLSHDSSVEADIARDFQTGKAPGASAKKKEPQDESIAAYFKDSEKVKTPKRKKGASKKTKKSPLSPMEAAAQADQTYNLGLASYRDGNYSDAKKYWEQTLALQPNHPQAERNLKRLKIQHPDLP
ncbi:MAG TPA: tetratricopeptide repeat protein [bacterium]|nr:tetratricopeptide repeat protein [bacterium]